MGAIRAAARRAERLLAAMSATHKGRHRRRSGFHRLTATRQNCHAHGCDNNGRARERKFRPGGEAVFQSGCLGHAARAARADNRFNRGRERR